MTTELMLLGIKYQQQFNAYLGSFPIEWDDSSQLYTFKRHIKRLKFYYFCIVYLLCSIDIGSTFLIIIIRWFQPDPNFTMEHFIIFGLVLVVMGFGAGIAISVFLLGQDGVICVNSLFNQFRYLRALLNKNKKKRKKKYTSDFQGLRKRVNDLSYEENGSFDVLGVSILYFASYSLWFPPMIAICVNIFDLNPIRHFAHAVLGDEFMLQWKVRIPAGFFYFVVLFLNTAQTIRLIQVIVILFVIPLQFYLKILNLINEIYSNCKTVKDFERQHLEYVKLQLINSFIIPTAEQESFMLMIVVRWIGVICMFIAIKLNSYLPAVVTIGAASGIFVIILMIMLLFPYTTKMLEESSSSIASWMYGVPPTQKYLQRKYSSLRHLRFYAGLPGTRFFMIERSTTTEFLMSIVDPAVDLMIGYPDADIKEMFNG